MDMMQLHSYRRTPAVVRATGSSASTQAYMVSNPFPAELKALRISIDCRDQGWYSDVSAGSYTWFEISVARPKSGLDRSEAFQLPQDSRRNVEDFLPQLRIEGFDLVAFPTSDLCSPAAPWLSTRLFSLQIPCSGIQKWQGLWHAGKETPPGTDRECRLLEILQRGDVLIIWASAQCLGWYNLVYSARMDVNCGRSQSGPDLTDGVSVVEQYLPADVQGVPRGWSDWGRFSVIIWDPRNVPEVKEAKLMSRGDGEAQLCTFPSTGSRIWKCVPSMEFMRHTVSSYNIAENILERFEAQGAMAAGHQRNMFRIVSIMEDIKIPDRCPRIIMKSWEPERPTWSPPRVSCIQKPFFNYDELATTDLTDLRLLQVLPRQSTDQTGLARCRITSHSSKTVPEYVALSYIWGDKEVYPIILNNKLFKVRANLLAFLLRVQQEPCSLEKLYWIDALCINQEDVSERNKIVPKMTKIYEASRHIIVWLGVGTEETAGLFDFLDLTPKGHSFSKHSHHARYEDVELELPPGYRALRHTLIAHPYWQRMWILQEASTPKFRPHTATYVWYADRKVLMNEFLGRVLDISHDQCIAKRVGIRICSPIERIAALSVARSPAFGHYCPPVTMASLLQHARRASCTDDRDRIYALLPLASDADRFEVDYSRPVEEVFRNFASCLLQVEDSLDILAFTDGRRSMESLPTWVPDWSCPDVPVAFPHTLWKKPGIPTQLAEQVQLTVTNGEYERSCPAEEAAAILSLQWEKQNLYNASLGLEAPNRISSAADAGALRLSGFVFDHVLTTDANLVFLQHASREARYRHVQCAGVQSEGSDMHRRIYWVSEGKSAIPDGFETPFPDSWKTALMEMMPSADQTLENRTLFQTNEGYIGLGSDRIRPGDLVCIIAGAQLPYILRAVERDEDVFEFCGEAYVHGVMDGEAVTDELKAGSGLMTFVVR